MFYGTVSHITISIVLQKSDVMTISNVLWKINYMTISSVL